MNRVTSDKSDARCLIEAVAWRTHLTESDLDATAEFERWLSADPRHGAAWEQVQGPWKLFGEQSAAPEILELRRAALANAQAAARERWTAGNETALPSDTLNASVPHARADEPIAFWLEYKIIA